MIFLDCFVALLLAMTEGRKGAMIEEGVLAMPIGGLDPILVRGDSGSWDDYRVSDGHVIIVNDTLKMWYLGQHSDHTLFPYKGIGYAYSVDSGKTWQKYVGNPVFYADSTSGWEHSGTGDDGLWEAVVIYEDVEYKMWYQSRDSTNCWNTLFARSLDGITWVRGNKGKPVVYAGWHEGGDLRWDSRYVGARSVIKRGGLYYVFYEGESWHALEQFSMGLAVGLNETTFVKVDTLNPTFTTKGTPDTLWCGKSIIPNVILDGNPESSSGFILLYSSNFEHTGKTTVGLAVSEDGVTWVRYSHNPVCDLFRLGYPGGAITSVYWDIRPGLVRELVSILRRIPAGIYSCDFSFLLVKP